MYQALDIYSNASWFGPALEAFIDASAKSFAHCMKMHAHCMEMHRTLVTLLAPHTLSYTEASTFMSETTVTADELAYHMDIAIGERHLPDDEMFAAYAGSPAGRAAQASAMDSAMGLRAA